MEELYDILEKAAKVNGLENKWVMEYILLSQAFNTRLNECFEDTSLIDRSHCPASVRLLLLFVTMQLNVTVQQICVRW